MSSAKQMFLIEMNCPIFEHFWFCESSVRKVCLVVDECRTFIDFHNWRVLYLFNFLALGLSKFSENKIILSLLNYFFYLISCKEVAWLKWLNFKYVLWNILLLKSLKVLKWNWCNSVICREQVTPVLW